MSNMVLYDRMVEQNALEAVKHIGTQFAKSGLFGVNSDAQGQVMAMTCLAEGITPVEFARRYHIVEGKLSMKADAMLAQYQALGGKVLWLESTDKICRARWNYGGNDIEISFTIEDACRAGLCGPDGARKPKQDNDGNWQKYPDAMLRARCASKAIRMLCPQVNAGIHCPEEDDGDDGVAPAVAPRRSPRRGSAVATPVPEPSIKEAEAHVVDDPAPEAPAVELDLSHIEDPANAFLRSLDWIRDGQTWRDLTAVQKGRIAGSVGQFCDKAMVHWEKNNDSANA